MFFVALTGSFNRIDIFWHWLSIGHSIHVFCQAWARWIETANLNFSTVYLKYDISYRKLCLCFFHFSLFLSLLYANDFPKTSSRPPLELYLMKSSIHSSKSRMCRRDLYWIKKMGHYYTKQTQNLQCNRDKWMEIYWRTQTHLLLPKSSLSLLISYRAKKLYPVVVYIGFGAVESFMCL